MQITLSIELGHFKGTRESAYGGGSRVFVVAFYSIGHGTPVDFQAQDEDKRKTYYW